ncbi:hypothetical protein BDR26DRAFT_852856 [Obelidium mucronatum]|nr:hypothetical protein BDR26DRAFT_852856 [Obelidium mucronatum]
MSKNSAKKGGKEPTPDQPPPFAEFLLPAPTISQIKEKVRQKRAAIAQSAEIWDLQTDSNNSNSLKESEPCFKGADALSIGPEYAIDLMLRVKTRDREEKEEALSTIRAWFNLQPPLNPPQSLLLCPSPNTAELEALQNPEAENVAARDTALAEYYYEALLESYGWGYSVAQSVHWLTLFAKTHEEYLDMIQKSKARGESNTSHCIGIFERNLKGLLTCSIPPWTCIPVSAPPIFSALEAKYMIDYFGNTYVKHLKLLTHFFTRPQEIDTTDFCEPKPLSGAIPAEKWDEYLRLKEDEQIAEMIRIRRQTIGTISGLKLPVVVEPEKMVIDAQEEEDLYIIHAPAPKEWPGLNHVIVTGEAEGSDGGSFRNNSMAAASIIARPASSVQPSGGGGGVNPAVAVPAPPPHPVKITADAPLNPQNIGTLLAANTLPLISSLVQHVEKKIDYQTTELLNRYQKLSSDRIAMKKYEKEEDEKVYAMQQQRAAVAAAQAAAAEAKASSASLASRGASAKTAKKKK